MSYQPRRRPIEQGDVTIAYHAYDLENAYDPIAIRKVEVPQAFKNNASVSVRRTFKEHMLGIDKESSTHGMYGA